MSYDKGGTQEVKQHQRGKQEVRKSNGGLEPNNEHAWRYYQHWDPWFAHERRFPETIATNVNAGRTVRPERRLIRARGRLRAPRGIPRARTVRPRG